MIEKSDDLWSQITTVASQVIGWCAQEILTVDALREQMLQEWRTIREGEDQPSPRLLTRMALRICSSALCAAWRSAQPDIRNRACDNLRRYLKRFLQNSNYAQRLWKDVHVTEDILQEVLEELYMAVKRNPRAGPDDPASFLKYAQVAALHHAHAYAQKHRQQIQCLSLEDMEEYQQEECVEILVEKREHNPQRYAEHYELQQILKDVILTLRNRRYQQVLLYTYLAGMEEHDLASYLGVSVQEIYMWRHRALQALRNKSEIIEVLRLYRE
jgi:RNA polymerase sigma factor (sigma-70 family)